MDKNDLKKIIRDIPDFPKKGIIFKDITTLLKDKDALRVAIDALAEKYKGQEIDAVIGIEARGFIFGTALAYKLGTGFIPVRKKGKLPYKTKKVTYDLEYGTDTLEIHEDALSKDSKVLIVDDLLATGGTVSAVAKLVKGQGASIVGVAFLVELGFLNGREKLGKLPVHSIITY
ncbi:MAG: adenine phosphoribosyltransferase [Omnitrophica WOR_2 bacterium GWA2_37_7]|nr:MAG: adenine phosphoribosyltransferase [Omnitrophica WOR_2 bacterium GWA2_37_7]OGX51090.1 MAG: adenine phosphoribosyltransferase [Omnitrophica WOR_2 bacterium RIFOXYA2_FULL_38_17]OGX56150.1 MAG: adenine phosphoribosyltransferase [Omnitrophica WOR_2 bacterium RIFOXYC2_FULL_38_12]